MKIKFVLLALFIVGTIGAVVLELTKHGTGHMSQFYMLAAIAVYPLVLIWGTRKRWVLFLCSVGTLVTLFVLMVKDGTIGSLDNIWYPWHVNPMIPLWFLSIALGDLFDKR